VIYLFNPLTQSETGSGDRMVVPNFQCPHGATQLSVPAWNARMVPPNFPWWGARMVPPNFQPAWEPAWCGARMVPPNFQDQWHYAMQMDLSESDVPMQSITVLLA
jgi:hypothetical protein